MVGRIEVSKYCIDEIKEIVRMLKEDGYIVAVDDEDDGGAIIYYVGR